MIYTIEKLKRTFSPRNINKGFNYFKDGKVGKIEVENTPDSITFSATVNGNNDNYNSSINLYKDNKKSIEVKCTCSAYINFNGECKHIAALAYKIGDEFKINDSFQIKPSHEDLDDIKEEYQESLSDDIINTLRTLSESQLSKIVLPYVKNWINNSGRTLRKTLDSVLKKKEQFDPSVFFIPGFKDIIETFDTSKYSLSVLDMIEPKKDETPLEGEDETVYRLKIDFPAQGYRNNFFLDLYECKLLKNGTVSSGQKLSKQVGRFPDKYYDYLPFQGDRGGGYWDRMGFNELPDAFINRIKGFDKVYESKSNKELSIEYGSLKLSVKQRNDNEYTILPVIKTEKDCIEIFNNQLFGKENSKNFAIYILEEKKLYFLQSTLPFSFVKNINEIPITLNLAQLTDFLKHQKSENLIKNTIDISTSGIPITYTKPDIFIELKISENYDFVSLSPVVEYGQGTVIRTFDESNYIRTLNGDIVKRDFENEKKLLHNISAKIGQIDSVNIDGTMIKYIDDNIDNFFQNIDNMINEGIKVEYLQPVKKVTNKNLSAKIDIKSNINWFDTDIEIKIGNEKFSDYDKLFDALNNGRNYITLDNGTVLKLHEDIKQFVKDIEDLGVDKSKINETQKLGKYNIGLIKDEINNTSSIKYSIDKEILEMRRALIDFKGIQNNPVPKDLHATLRDYQIQGYNRLLFLQKYTFSGILADDMGLGKTIQTISLFLHTYTDKSITLPSLVVCPKSLTFNWSEELQKFAPDLKVQTISTAKDGFNGIEKDTQIIIVSYGILNNIIENGFQNNFHYIVLDEAQNVKNANTKRAKGIFGLQSRYRLALSGTPIENNLMELWSIFNFLMPGFLGSQNEFNNKFIKGEKENLKVLASKINPFILRRTKDKVIKELPPKVEEHIYLEMGEKQKKFYDTLKDAYKTDIIQKIKTEGLNKSRFAVLDALLKLRQACLMPQLIKMPGNNLQESIKLDYITENIEEMINSGHNLLIFSQFTSFLDYVKSSLDSQGIKYNYLDGKTKDRKSLVDGFNNGEVNVFIISLKAGGTGLNLVAADYVLILDPWRNPAVENQAADRAHRIGQTKTVFVQKLIIKDSIEEKILKLQESKKKLIEDLFEGNFSGQLDENDLRYIFE